MPAKSTRHKSAKALASLFLLAGLFGAAAGGVPGEETAQGVEGAREPEEIIFALRSINTRDGHWYANLGYYAQGPEVPAAGKFGSLCRLNLKNGSLTVLLDDPDGTVRDPQVHYDGKKILFSYRRGKSDNFDLYEIGVDGKGLQQLTGDPWDDIEPTYLPDGGIAFCSNRSKRWVPCYVTQVATLYRCDADGRNIRAISANVEHDNHPWVLNDGRIIYTRWEYSDRSYMHYHHLWSMNPDGTGQMIYYGNQHPGGVFIDAKPLPDSQKVIFIDSPKHGKKEHAGNLALLDPGEGPDAEDRKTVIAEGMFRDPYPLSSEKFLVAEGAALHIIDIHGNRRKIYSVPATLAAQSVWAHEPRPLLPHSLEPAIPHRVDLTKQTGTILVMDAYRGRNMDGIKKGSIKELLILENLPIPTAFSGGMEPISWGGSYFLNRILGTVPVEADGSVFAEIPALRALQLVALDENSFSVKRMQSFFAVMPGEVNACKGCHENRTTAVQNMPAIQALKRPPSRIQPIAGMPEIFDYPRDIQPIWDRHCLGCHDVDKRAGGVLLTNDQGPIYTHSYFMLSSRLQMADGRCLARSNYPPYKLGSSASYLISKIDGSHYGAKVSDDDLRKIKLWIDASATFAGTYAALGSGMFGGEMPSLDPFPKSWNIRESGWPSVEKARQALRRRCASCHTGERKLPEFPSDHMGLKIHHMPFYGKDEFSWVPPWIREDKDLRPASLAWAKKYLDPRNVYSHNILYNLSRPDKSVLLLAPLARSSGGYAACSQVVFRDTQDPDYELILNSIREARTELMRITRFNMPNFRPAPEYLREMKRYGILPESHNPEDPIDVYKIDRKYWQAFYPESHLPSPAAKTHED